MVKIDQYNIILHRQDEETHFLYLPRAVHLKYIEASKNMLSTRCEVIEKENIFAFLS